MTFLYTEKYYPQNRSRSVRDKWTLTGTPLFLVLSILFLVGCPDEDGDSITECPEGYHLCGEDSTDCCLDTTSHDFVWDVDTLGESGVLWDVWAFDENNVWV
ncbi:MAG: hypothetical protein ACE5EE_09125, partial [Fidelibacterota bacterium]